MAETPKYAPSASPPIPAVPTITGPTGNLERALSGAPSIAHQSPPAASEVRPAPKAIVDAVAEERASESAPTAPAVQPVAHAALLSLFA
jgi:hypothetical protein